MNNLQISKSKYAKKEDVLKEFCNNSPCINIDQQEKHYRGKCAEIFIENGKYFINCYFCGKNVQNMENLILHIYQEHFKLNVPDPWEQQEDEHHISNNIETDADKIVVKSDSKLDVDSINYFSVKDNDTVDLDTIYTNEIYNGEINDRTKVNEVDNLDIPNKPIHYRDINGEYPCSFCVRSFKKLDELEIHFITHSSTLDRNKIILKSADWKDEIYGNNINNFATDNIKAKRHEDGTYHCEVCNRKYIHHYNYRAHFLQAHQPNLNPYKCPDCPLTYTMRHRFEIHRRTHTGEKPYKCPHCPRAFALNTNLTRHVYIHLGKKPYLCRYCGKGFTQQNSQKAHERNIHTKERPHQCELCGKAFPRSTLLKEHWKRHTNTRPFQCTICFKNFFNNSSLKLHFNTHTGEKSYDCNLCSKKFTNVNSLRTHKKLHLDTKQYQCKLCDKAFAQNAGLYGHMKIYHENVTKVDN